jgi:hypothetical protein
MFRGSEALAAVVDDVAVAPTGEAIAAARRQIDRLEAKVAAAEAEYLKSGGFEVDGYGSMGAFLRHECGMTTAESNRVACRAKKLARWPEVGDGWVDGRVTGTQVQVMTAKVPDRHVERFAITAADTVDIIGPLSTFQTQKAIGHWAKLADDFAQREAIEAGEDPAEMVPEREMSAARTLDDRLETRGSFDPDSASYIEAALHAAQRPDRRGERRSPLQRRADAMVEISRFYLAHHRNPPGSGRPDRGVITADVVVLHRAILRGLGVRTAAQLEQFLTVNPDMGALERGLFLTAFDATPATARTIDGHPVTDTLLRHVTVNGILERLLTVEGRIIDHGRSVRVFTEAQKRAMAVRDTGGRTDDTSPWNAHAHHSPPFEQGGTTDVNRGYLKGRHDHLKHHRDGFTDRLEPDGTLQLTHPTGATRTTRPPGWTNEPSLPIHTSSQRAPVMPFRAPPATDAPAESAEPVVSDDDLLAIVAVVDGHDWVVLGEDPADLVRTTLALAAG